MALDIGAAKQENSTVDGSARADLRRYGGIGMDRAAWDERYKQAEWLWSLEPNRFVAEVLGGREPGRALDLACGEGRNALWLASRGWRVTAVDFSEVAVEKGRRRAGGWDGAGGGEGAGGGAAGGSVEWAVADVTVYCPEPGGYDLVLIAYLHLSAEEIDAVLRRAAAALAPGGTLLVVGHDVTNLSEGVGGPQDPRVLYTPEALAASLGSLRVERAERVRRPVAGAPREAIDVLAVAVRD
jgi:SAM-dependent methyltransferase